jgi:hypothetical protein
VVGGYGKAVADRRGESDARLLWTKIADASERGGCTWTWQSCMCRQLRDGMMGTVKSAGGER